MKLFKNISSHPFFIKLLHWEYWSFNAVYGPIYIYWIWLGIKARSFFFFNASNPAIKNGGFLLESKKAIYDIIPAEYYPPTLFFNSGTEPRQILKKLCESNMQFPIIGKPDIGGRGKGVKKLDTENDVIEYLQNSKVDFLLQQFIPYENEVGIFYYRFPGEEKGHISGIVGKEFLTVSGDGSSTIEKLLQKNKRYILQLPVLKKTYDKELKRILEKDEKQVLVPYGNHARGAKFIDMGELIDEQLTLTIDILCKKIPGFYFGRMDVKYSTWEELKAGKNFSVIEVNGAGSEPTHIYDPKHSLFFAWKEIIRHWILLWKISRLNHKLYNIPYMDFRSGIKMFRENSAFEKMIAKEPNT